MRTGPYAVVRNPLYLAEEVAIVGALLQFYSPSDAAAVPGALASYKFVEYFTRRTFCAVHSRTTMTHMKSTARLVPYIW